MACLKRSPCLFLIEDNGYAISVPLECQTAGGNISTLVSGFPHLFPLKRWMAPISSASYRTLREAARYCRAGRGPALVHAHVVRLYSHSLSDDERMYKTAAERKRRNGTRPRSDISRNSWSTKAFSTAMRLQFILHEIDEEIHEATQEALRQEPPSPCLRTGPPLFRSRGPQRRTNSQAAPQFHREPKTMVDLLNATLREEMRRNPEIVVFGEDVADCSAAKRIFPR